MLEPYTSDLVWLVVVGFLVAFLLAFGIGANDVANSFGTSVGSKVLTVRQACYLATVFEVAGAVLIGYKVSDTMRKGILEVDLYRDSEVELMLGCLSSLSASAIWLLVATFLKLPISGTHSIVGATVGFSLVARGTQGLHWGTLGMIVASWFISPVLSGLMSVVLYKIIHRFVLLSSDPLKAGFLSLPFFYGCTILINVFSIVHDGPKLLYMDHVPTWGAALISVAIGLITAILVHLFLVPWQKRKLQEQHVSFTFGDSAESSPNRSPCDGNRAKRPISILSETKTLPAISESKEMIPINKMKSSFPGSYNTDTPVKNGHLDKKMDATLVKKAENLLGHVSLDNVDLTITSLNYIDDNMGKRKSLQSHFDIRNGASHRALSPESNSQLRNATSSCNASPKGSNMLCYENRDVINFKITDVDSADISSNRNMEKMTLSPNSSGVPLIGLGDPPAGNGTCTTVAMTKEKEAEVSKLFSFLQVLTATFGSFAHGGNDVSNAIGPLIALWMIYSEGSVLQKSETPLSILLFGGIGISLGLWLWGRRVIQTIGEDLTTITPSTGFTIEIGAAFTVLLASKVGIPISTTHCKVGSVVFVGYASAEGGVDWALFRNIIYAWVVTVPVAALLSAGCMYGLCAIVL